MHQNQHPTRSAFVIVLNEDDALRFPLDLEVKRAFSRQKLAIDDSERAKGCNTTYLAVSSTRRNPVSLKRFIQDFADAYDQSGLPRVPGHTNEQFRVASNYQESTTAHEAFASNVRFHRYSP